MAGGKDEDPESELERRRKALQEKLSFLNSPPGGTGLSAAQPQSAGRKKLAAGEPITVDYAGIYQATR